MFPIWVYKIVSSNFKDLRTKRVSRWYGIFYEDMRTDNLHSALYNVYFMIRRFLMVIVLVFMNFSPFFQSVSMSLMSIVNFSYIMSNKPYQDRRVYHIECFNEMTIYICSL